MDRRTKHRQCSEKGDWPVCCVCDGRIHREDCTSRRDRNRDCCVARHKMLHDQGITRGIGDSSMIMWTPLRPWGCHEDDLKGKV